MLRRWLYHWADLALLKVERDAGMRLQRKIVIGSLVAAWVASLFAPLDLLCQLTLAVAAALPSVITLSILARRDDFRASSRFLQSLVCVLVCLVSVLLVSLYVTLTRITCLSQSQHSLQSQETALVVQAEYLDRSLP